MGEHNKRQLARFIAMSAVLLSAGTLAFHYDSGLSYGEAFYETLIILLTHYDHYGFKEPMSRLIVVLLILASLVLVAYLLKWFAEYMMGIGDNVKRLRMKKAVDKLKNHYIICGLGRVGSQIAREMHQEGASFVVLDRDKVKIEEAITQGYLAIQADSTDESALHLAGIGRATGLVATLGEDSQNLLVTLAAKSINSNLFIVARANRQENEIKLRRAGADRVALPYQIGGYHMAAMLLRPSVVDYMDIMSNTRNAGSDLAVEEMIVGEHSKLAGGQLGKALVEGTTGATVIAINGADGTSKVRPSGHEVVYPGDRLILLGAKKDLTEASALIR